LPLSDRERKVLEELELDLAAEDPRLAQELSSGFAERGVKASKHLAAIGCLTGVVILMAGIATQIIIVGVAGFLLMGTGTYFLVEGTRWTHHAAPIGLHRNQAAEEGRARP
jgi:hypothetical protein